MAWISLLLFIVPLISAQQGSGRNDVVTDVPGLNFKATFNQYSGYLNATDGKYFFYWFVESQSNPSTDPIILWLNGGPGCSSLSGFLEENGPFHINPDGSTLYENVFSWNKFANVIFLESPSGVGYSYSSPKNDTTNDDLTAYHNFQALRDFFYNKFPEYQSHDFYIAGESYGGVYVPTLAKNVIDGIAAGTFPNNFKGMAIGNGALSGQQLFNSLLNLFYYHGIRGADEWNSLLNACCPNNRSDYCDFKGQLHNPDCRKEVFKFRTGPWANDHYNQYQDCYDTKSDTLAQNAFDQLLNYQFFKSKPVRSTKVNSIPPGTSDMSHQLNYDSTDALFGFPCWGSSSEPYFNLLDVKKALNVAPDRLDEPWCECCNIPYIHQSKYDDMSDTFTYILKNSNIRILIYNGDVDLVCNYLGDQWFIEREVAPENNLKVVDKRAAWWYRNQIVGFVKRFERLDLLTVRGSGHFVPTDRAGPALQMIYNFVQNKNYSNATGIDVNPKPLNPSSK